MRAILGHDDIGRCDVAVDNAVLVKLLHRLANLADKLYGRIRRKPPVLLYDVRKRIARHVIIDDNEPVGQLIRCLHAWQTVALTFAERRPHVALRQGRGNFLAYERAGAGDAHQFGDTGRPTGECALDMVGIVDAHRMHRLLVIHVSPFALLRRLIPESWSLNRPGAAWALPNGRVRRPWQCGRIHCVYTR